MEQAPSDEELEQLKQAVTSLKNTVLSFLIDQTNADTLHWVEVQSDLIGSTSPMTVVYMLDARNMLRVSPNSHACGSSGCGSKDPTDLWFSLEGLSEGKALRDAIVRQAQRKATQYNVRLQKEQSCTLANEYARVQKICELLGIGNIKTEDPA